MRLTKAIIGKAEYEGTDNARCVLWDDDPRGLGLRIFPSGRKSWVLSYRVAGRKRMMALADYGVLTIDQARSRAKRELAAIENQSADPLAEKRKRALEAKTGTVEAMFRAFIADKKQKSADELLRQAGLHIFPAFGNRGWQEVARSEVRSWHEGIKAPYAANRALAALRAAYYWRLWREDDSPKAKQRDFRNPCVGIEMRPEKARQVRLERDDLPKLQTAINAEKDPYIRALFRFLLAVGCRRNEALTLKWDDVRDGDNPSVTFRDTKSGEDRTVPLSPYAASLLASLKRIKGNPYVFAGRTRGAPLQSVSKAWQRIRKTAGIEHIHIHDLRRSFGSWLGDAGFTSKQIGAVLGHKSDITSRVYMALGDESKRAAVNAMEALMTGKKAKVAKFPKRAAR